MRARSAKVTKARHKRLLKRAEGFRGARRKLFRQAKETVIRADAFATAHRRQKKRHFRQLWIIRLNAAAKANGMSYSRFIHGIQKAGIALNRKELSEIAIHDEKAFTAICDQAKQALAA